MASNSFGNIFRIHTWGESHGSAIGVVIDGCPAGLPIDAETINAALARRRPGKSPYTSPRKENDLVEIASGLFEGITTGAPISLLIKNQDADSSSYEPLKELLRPGHANYTYLEKYGLFDHRGGGRASARETAARVAAGAVAMALLKQANIQLTAYIKQIGPISAEMGMDDITRWQSKINQSHLCCPDPQASEKMCELIDLMIAEGDSVGGVVEFVAWQLPVGLGDPVYEKLEAKLASAMMSLPASKAFEIGSGMAAAAMRGSEHNDSFAKGPQGVYTLTNHAGGTLGGISTGMPLVGRVAFKPTSSIKRAQATLTRAGAPVELTINSSARHDPCVAIRAVPVVEAMAALVLADSLLLQRCSHSC